MPLVSVTDASHFDRIVCYKVLNETPQHTLKQK